VRSPTQMTLNELRKRGHPVDVVEHWMQFPGMKQGRRKDLFNFIDIIYLDLETREIVGVQTTSGSHRTDRLDKIIMSKHARHWMLCNGAIEIWSWRKIRKKKKDGKLSKVSRYEPSITQVTLEDIPF